MALGTPTLLDTTTESSNDSSITSGSISPTGDALLIVAMVTRTSGGSRAVTGVSDTLTGTGSWTIDVQTVGTASGYVDVALCTAKAGSSPGSGTVTVTLSGNSARKCLHVAEITGQDTSTPVQQTKSNTGSGATLSITLDSSPASDSCVMGCNGDALSGVSGDTTPGANYMELADSNLAQGAGNVQNEVEYDLTPTSTTVDWSGLESINNAGVAIEINAAGAPAGGDSLAPFGNLRKRKFQPLFY